MMCWASLASSRAVILWSGSCRPVELVKFDCVSPSSFARLFIMSAKASSLPAMPSASAMQASLPDWIITPCNRSRTLTRLFSAANIAEPPDGAPPLRQAFSLMVISSSYLSLPSAIACRTTSVVISLDMLAGGLALSALRSNSTVPLSASIRIA